VNVVVLWNTIYMDAAMAHLRRDAPLLLPWTSFSSRPSNTSTSTSSGSIPLLSLTQSTRPNSGLCVFLPQVWP
jgi:hypothetical protein